MDFKDVSDALMFLIGFNDSPRENLKVNGGQPTFEDLQEANREAIYSICDFLGLSDLYLEKEDSEKVWGDWNVFK